MGFGRSAIKAERKETTDAGLCTAIVLTCNPSAGPLPDLNVTDAEDLIVTVANEFKRRVKESLPVSAAHMFVGFMAEELGLDNIKSKLHPFANLLRSLKDHPNQKAGTYCADTDHYQGVIGEIFRELVQRDWSGQLLVREVLNTDEFKYDDLIGQKVPDGDGLKIESVRLRNAYNIDKEPMPIKMKVDEMKAINANLQLVMQVYENLLNSHEHVVIQARDKPEGGDEAKPLDKSQANPDVKVTASDVEDLDDKTYDVLKNANVYDKALSAAGGFHDWPEGRKLWEIKYQMKGRDDQHYDVRQTLQTFEEDAIRMGTILQKGRFEDAAVFQQLFIDALQTMFTFKTIGERKVAACPTNDDGGFRMSAMIKNQQEDGFQSQADLEDFLKYHGFSTIGVRPRNGENGPFDSQKFELSNGLRVGNIVDQVSNIYKAVGLFKKKTVQDFMALTRDQKPSKEEQNDQRRQHCWEFLYTKADALRTALDLSSSHMSHYAPL